MWANTGFKICARCKERKPLTEFRQTGDTKDGYGVWCKNCHSEYEKEWRERRLEQGLCLICGRPNVDAGRRRECPVCRDREKKLREKRLKEGLCVTCGRPNPDAPTHRQCTACRKKQKERYWYSKGGRVGSNIGSYPL